MIDLKKLEFKQKKGTEKLIYRAHMAFSPQPETYSQLINKLKLFF